MLTNALFTFTNTPLLICRSRNSCRILRTLALTPLILGKGGIEIEGRYIGVERRGGRGGGGGGEVVEGR